MKSLLSLLALLIVPTLVAGCVTAPSKQTVVVKAVCPVLRQYPPDFMTRAEREVEALPVESALARLVDDYLNLRDQVRVCRGQKA